MELRAQGKTEQASHVEQRFQSLAVCRRIVDKFSVLIKTVPVRIQESLPPATEGEITLGRSARGEDRESHMIPQQPITG